MSGGSGIPNSDLHSIVSSLGKFANIVDDAKHLCSGWLNNGGGGSPLQGIENILRDVCARLDDLSRHVDVASKSFDRFVDTVESLPFRETPVVLMKKETAEGAARSPRSSKKYRHGATTDMAHAVHVNRNRKLGNKIVTGQVA
jgi:hypothetical protein